MQRVGAARLSPDVVAASQEVCRPSAPVAPIGARAARDRSCWRPACLPLTCAALCTVVLPVHSTPSQSRISVLMPSSTAGPVATSLRCITVVTVVLLSPVGVAAFAGAVGPAAPAAGAVTVLEPALDWGGCTRAHPVLLMARGCWWQRARGAAAGTRGTGRGQVQAVGR